MFGEYKSQSPKLPSPWSNPYINVPRSKLGTPNPIVINYLPCDLLDSTLSEFSTFESDNEDRDIDEGLPSAESLEESTEDDSVSELSSKRPTEGGDYDHDDANVNDDDDDDQATQLAISFDSGGRIRKSNSLARRISSTDLEPGSSPVDGLQRLSAEVDEKGHIEYKLKLSAATPDRFNRLVTQLQWRLLEGGGEAIYEIGVLDDGTLVGLPRSELLSSLRTLEKMAEELGATVLVVKEIRLPALSTSTLDLGDETGKRGKWLKWAASQETASNREQRKSTKWEAKLAQMNGAHQASIDGKSPAVEWGPENAETHGQRFINRFGTGGRRRRRGPRHRSSDHARSTFPGSTSSLPSVTTSDPLGPNRIERAFRPDDTNRSSRKKKIESLLDSDNDDDDDDDYTNTTSNPKANPSCSNPVQHQPAFLPAIHTNEARPRAHVRDIDLEMFAVLDLGVGERPADHPETISNQELVGAERKHGGAYSDKKSRDEAKAAIRRLKKAEKAAAAARTFPKKDLLQVDRMFEDDLSFLSPLSLDDDNNVEEENSIESPFLTTPTGPGDIPLPSTLSCPDYSSSSTNTATTDNTTNNNTTTTPAMADTSDINSLPSPILRAYRPPPSLLPRSGLVSDATKVIHARSRKVSTATVVGSDTDANTNNDANNEDRVTREEDEEDGSERLCVEVLVMRKEMKTFINLEDFGAKVLSDRD
ncbi:Predicted translation elongation factor [Phaffia rhodozyma]|uniref:Predicted translation elongation factor n=1 Tax=Phaffia rhodozyma TaxID=264483 RepID=A0A0F7SS63_PHARH|nr:Predicted translation elongation factor [Phaffia rhodozyma]